MRHVILGFTVIAFMTGCSKNEVDLGEVSGRVTMNGKPLPEALVQFMPTGGGRSSQGRTDADGRYKLDYSARATGALVGPNKVVITTGNLEDPTHRDETVAFKYNFESTIVEDVKAGENVFDFDVEPR